MIIEMRTYKTKPGKRSEFFFVRFVIYVTPNSARFEQAFSDDGGKTWEVNWIATDTRGK